MAGHHDCNKKPLLLQHGEKRGRPSLFSASSEKPRSLVNMTNLLRCLLSLCLAYTVLARAFPARPQTVLVEDVPKPLQQNVCVRLFLDSNNLSGDVG